MSTHPEETFMNKTSTSIPVFTGPRYGFDLDGCSANFYEGLIRKGRELGFKRLRESWQEITDYRNPMPDFYSIFAAVHRDMDFWSGLPVLEKPKIRPVCWITQRPQIPGLIAITHRWLRLNGILTAPVYIVEGCSGKAIVARQLRLDCIVDDCPDNYVELTRKGVNCKLLDRPWNRAVDAGLDRIYSLDLGIGLRLARRTLQ